jgi:hypothetical protein
VDDLESYSTIVAKLVAIEDLSKLKHVVDRLEKHFSLSNAEAQKVVESLPYKLPVSFFTVKEAKIATHELSYFGCEIEIIDMMEEEEEPEPEESEVLEVEPEAEIVEKVVEKSETPIAVAWDDDKKVEIIEEKPKYPPWALPAAIGAALLVVVMSAFLLFQDKSDDVVEVVDEQPFESEVLNEVARSVEKKMASMKSLDLFLDDLTSYLEEKQVTEEERELLSDHFVEKAAEKKEEEKLSVHAVRSLKLLEVAIGFNRRNRNAWMQMIELYRSNGLKYRAKKAQKEMDAIFADG